MILNIYGFYQLIWLMSVLRKIYNLRLYLPAIFMIQVWLIFSQWFCSSTYKMEKASDFDSYISAGVPLTRRDKDRDKQLSDSTNFYSRASREARPGNALENGVGFHFYSHASREARPMRGAFCTQASVFLLTRLIRGATRPLLPVVIKQMHFYTRASCEARLQIQ